MVNIKEGNIFESKKQSIVNAVNCTGFMGAGIALEYRLRYPKMYDRYKKLCQDRLFGIGKLWIYKDEQLPWILNFPTKDDWKAPTDKQYLIDGLENFCRTYKERGITSIAFPLLGADKGGLGQEKSMKILVNYLSDVDIDVDIYIYKKTSSDSWCNKVKTCILNNEPSNFDHIVKLSKSDYQRVKLIFQNESIYQLSELLSFDGIGIKTVEKLYQLIRFQAPPMQSKLI